MTIQCLKLAGVISQDIDNNTNDIRNINWIGGNIYVVQLGDQIDNCRPDQFNTCNTKNFTKFRIFQFFTKIRSTQHFQLDCPQ